MKFWSKNFLLDALLYVYNFVMEIAGDLKKNSCFAKVANMAVTVAVAAGLKYPNKLQKTRT